MSFNKPIHRIANVRTGVTLGTPDVTPELKKTIAEGVLQIAGNRCVEQVAQEENEMLVGLLDLRTHSNGPAMLR